MVKNRNSNVNWGLLPTGITVQSYRSMRCARSFVRLILGSIMPKAVDIMLVL